jgi:hypothetical protein
MSRVKFAVAAATTVLVVSACSDLSTGSATNTLLLSSAFQTVPAGFSATSNSFDASGDQSMPFFPDDFGGTSLALSADRGGHGGHGDHGGAAGADNGEHRGGEVESEDHHDGFGRGGIEGLLMGGGLGPEFMGGIGFGRGRGHGPFGELHIPSNCTFDATSGRIDCPDTTRHGLTLSLSFALKNAAGDAQSAFDTVTTDYVNVQTSVSGTLTRHDSAQATISHSSDRTITGLADGSTARTINGTAEGEETVNGVRDSVAFTAVRNVSDTTTDLVIPIADGRPTIPTSGVVIRNMSVSITPAGGTATTRSRREQITFDGTNVVQIVVTQNGTTKNCTVTLPRRKMTCQ